MVRRNRRRGAGGYIFPLQFAGLAVVASGVALGYLWLDSRCESLAKELVGIESHNEELRQQCANEESRWAQKKSPGHIKQALLEHNMGMVAPAEDHIVRLRAAPRQAR